MRVGPRWMFLAVVLLAASCQSSQPRPGDPDAGVKLMPPSGQVAIYRDEWDVPHIYADSEPSGFYGLGYAQGQDSLDLLFKFYLMAEGKLAAALGNTPMPPFAGNFSKSDFDALAWRHMEYAERGIARLSPELRKNYEAYLAGLNQYISEHPEQVPAWAPKLDLLHLVAFSRAILWEYYTLDGLAECATAGVKLAMAAPRDQPLVHWGSNEWAVAPWRTADNATIVLSDPHGEADGVTFYEFGMHAGDLNVSGYSFGPLMILTHNADVSWGMTTGAPDVSDCYAIDVDPKNPRRYAVDGVWKEMSSRDLVIEVKGAEPVRKTAEYADLNGQPALVVARDGNRAYAISTSYMETAGLFDEEVYRMNKARNVADVKKAASLLGMFPQNLMVGDSSGNLYYLRDGRTPKRPKGYDFSKPVSGNTLKTAWQGIYPVEDLLQIENPRTGYMENDNTPPDFMVQGKPLVRAEDYPPEIYNSPAFLKFWSRSERSNQFLSRQYHMTFDEAKTFATDETWVYADRWLEKLNEAASIEAEAISKRDPEFRQLLDELLAFDGVARKESKGALAFFYWHTAMIKGLTPDQRGSLEKAVADRRPLPDGLASKLIEFVDTTLTTLKTKHGGINVAYGDVFRMGATMERSVPIGGGHSADFQGHFVCRALEQPAYSCAITMRAFGFGDPDEKGRRLAVSGSRAIRLVEFTKPLKSYTLHNFGQSTDPKSPHRDDQSRQLSTDGQLKSTYFNASELAGHIQSTKVLKVPAP